uniref:Tc1-like transposase DDE domain-containing protein n=1 Tax=Panagrolaimus superbus TaxID=310955 RepID=A0A914YHI7_9BILA
MLQLRHQLLSTDYNKRLEFAEDQLCIAEVNPDFINKIMFTDEAHFCQHGGVNRYNYRYYSESNPNWRDEKPLHSPKLTVWAGIGKLGILGPYFFDGTVNSLRYMEVIEEVIEPALETEQFRDMILMQDGAPPHWAVEIREKLNEIFPEKWIGRDSPTYPWPPRSPDLTACDYFLWGYVKSKVYATPIRDLVHLKHRIIEEFERLDPDIIAKCC